MLVKRWSVDASILDLDVQHNLGITLDRRWQSSENVERNPIVGYFQDTSPVNVGKEVVIC